MRSQDHSQCSSHVVQGELLPKIDDDIDTVLGLSVFYQYVRTTALNQQQQTQHVSVFTTELFAHYLHIRCLSVMKCCQLTQMSATDEVQRYLKCFYELREMFVTDVLAFNCVNCAKYSSKDKIQTVVSGQTLPERSHVLDTSELVELLRKSAIEHLTTYRQLVALQFSSVDRPRHRTFEPMTAVFPTDLEALYAYRRGEYQRCLQFFYTQCTLADWWCATMVSSTDVSRVYSVDVRRCCLTHWTHADCQPVGQRKSWTLSPCYCISVSFVAVSDDSVSYKATSPSDITGSDPPVRWSGRSMSWTHDT